MAGAGQLTVRVLSGLALAAAGLLSGCGGGPSPLDAVGLNYPIAQDYPIHGIDVSKFQGAIDWNAVAGSGVKFAWIKATEGGDRVDQRFQANWTGAKSAGIAHGAYHFVYWCRPPLEEITWFEQNAPAEDDALPPVLDVEATPTSKTCHRHLTQESALADMKVMLDELERHYGKRPIIYTTVDFYQAILSDGAFMDYSIWVRSTKYHPAVKYGLRPWRFWQYQSDGAVAGIASNVDRDAFFGTEKQWEAFLSDREAAAPRLDAPNPAAQQSVAQGAAAQGAAGTQAGAAQTGAPEAVERRQAPPQPNEQQAEAQQPDDQSQAAQ